MKGTYRADTTISVTDPKPIYVRYVAPTATILRVTMPFSITIRVAGEKWNEVCLDLLEDGGAIGHVCIERQPGSPDRQSATIQGEMDLLKSHALRVSYDADDEPVNGRVKGGNPVWLETADGRKRLHHTFVVSQGGPEQTWEPDPFSLLVVAGAELTFEGRSTDLGPDDLTLSWDWRPFPRPPRDCQSPGALVSRAYAGRSPAQLRGASRHLGPLSDCARNPGQRPRLFP